MFYAAEAEAFGSDGQADRVADDGRPEAHHAHLHPARRRGEQGRAESLNHSSCFIQLKPVTVVLCTGDAACQRLGEQPYEGDPSEWLKPPVDLHLGCSVTLPGQ